MLHRLVAIRGLTAMGLAAVVGVGTSRAPSRRDGSVWADRSAQPEGRGAGVYATL
jgi:hypothetical protein